MSTVHPASNISTREIPGNALSGFLALTINIVWILGMLKLISMQNRIVALDHHLWWRMALCVLGLAVGLFALRGYFSLQPNEARVLILFGNYRGTVREAGFHWANPFYSRGGSGLALFATTRPALLTAPVNPTKLSLRARNFNSSTLKVNDKRGNPVEIAAVVVWRIADTAQAAFDVEDFKSYVEVQSESAIRAIASRFAYDHGEEQEATLRGSADEVAHTLQEELQARLAKAGVLVEEARLTHLAYAPEIASVMLRRQQAEAIVAARQQIVKGAVETVRAALTELDNQQIVHLDAERRAAMVSNLLVVLCGNSDATPVINTGTLYG
jgi:regulator of protease activity HflC (stomatin/prohibitin superfamily)